MIVILKFGFVQGSRVLWSLPHICVVYLPRKVLIFDYFLTCFPHTNFLFTVRETFVTLNLVLKVANPISQVPPWLPALGSSGHLPWHKLQPSHGDYQAKKKVKRGSQNIWYPFLSIASESVYSRAEPQTQKLPNFEITLDPTGSIHKKTRGSFTPKRLFLLRGD